MAKNVELQGWGAFYRVCSEIAKKHGWQDADGKLSPEMQAKFDALEAEGLLDVHNTPARDLLARLRGDAGTATRDAESSD